MQIISASVVVGRSYLTIDSASFSSENLLCMLFKVRFTGCIRQSPPSSELSCTLVFLTCMPLYVSSKTIRTYPHQSDAIQRRSRVPGLHVRFQRLMMWGMREEDVHVLPMR